MNQPSFFKFALLLINDGEKCLTRLRLLAIIARPRALLVWTLHNIKVSESMMQNFLHCLYCTEISGLAAKKAS